MYKYLLCVCMYKYKYTCVYMNIKCNCVHLSRSLSLSSIKSSCGCGFCPEGFGVDLFQATGSWTWQCSKDKTLRMQHGVTVVDVKYAEKVVRTCTDCRLENVVKCEDKHIQSFEE